LAAVAMGAARLASRETPKVAVSHDEGGRLGPPTPTPSPKGSLHTRSPPPE
jgi:hypothetical protein